MNCRSKRHLPMKLILMSLSALALGACDGSDSSPLAPSAAGTITRNAPASAPVAKPPATEPIAAVGTATLSWTAPETNTDGSTLTNLAGYTIVYGTSSSALDQSVELDDPSSTTYTISALATGTWYFALNAINADGTLSALSTVATKVIAN